MRWAPSACDQRAASILVGKNTILGDATCVVVPPLRSRGYTLHCLSVYRYVQQLPRGFILTCLDLSNVFRLSCDKITTVAGSQLCGHPRPKHEQDSQRGRCVHACVHCWAEVRTITNLDAHGEVRITKRICFGRREWAVWSDDEPNVGGCSVLQTHWC